MFGRKLLYTAGFLLFIAGSALCGYATSLPWLISFRVMQAIGGALITSNSVAIVVMIMGPEERGRGLGLQSAAQAVGLGLPDPQGDVRRAQRLKRGRRVPDPSLACPKRHTRPDQFGESRSATRAPPSRTGDDLAKRR